VNGDLPKEAVEPSEQPPTSSIGSATEVNQVKNKFISVLY
jgi:hypothetical protein